MSRMSPGNPLQHILKRQLGDLYNIQSKLYDERINVAKNLFRKDLFCHYGCVNAIEFSKNGEYLVSGGDDRRVILWKFGEALLDHGEPQQMTSQHLSNIFCLTLTPDISHIYSGGNDYQVIVHDTQTKRVVELLPHQKAVSGLSLDPTNSKILATAGNDGRLLLFDTRQSVEESLVVSRSRKPYHGVVFHPTQEGLIAAANAVNGATLWDLRKTKIPVMRYGDSAQKAILENCMSVCFDTLGTRILALRRRLPPVLYAVDKQEAIANFYHPDYYNSCTMKSCCFAGERDQYVVSGSDDFNLYMWKVPEKEKAWVDQTHMVLSGHRSIVNQVRYNSKYCTIASSGVEKIIKTWSPLEVPGSRGALLDEHAGNDNPRTVYSHEEYVSLVYYSGQYISHNYSDQSTMEDPRMMAFFDSLVQREIEGWSADDTDSHSVSDSSGGAHGVTTRRQATSMNTSLQSSRHKDTEDSSDSDQLLVDFLPLPPKRTTNGVRSQRCLRMATRQSKLARLAQKRSDSRRKQKSTVTSARVRTSRTLTRRAVAASGNSANNNNLHHHATRRRDVAGCSSGMGAGSSSVSSHILRHQLDSHSSSDGEESDSPPQQRPHQRHTSKMTRSNRRRMTMSRNYDRKNKPNTSNTFYRGKGKGTMRKGSCNFTKGLNMSSNTLSNNSSCSSTFIESAYTEDNLAVPSTSTGIRGTNSTPLFRINEADSDDDQSGASHSSLPNDSLELPLVSIIPTPINGIHNNSNVNINPTDIYNNNVTETTLSRYEYQEQNLEDWNVNNRQPSSTLARLRNETNESEMESSCSTGSTIEDNVVVSPPKRRIANDAATTPDSGILTAPSSSSGQRPTSRDNDLSDEPDWVIAKHRQRVKRARRNYRTHIGDSDST